MTAIHEAEATRLLQQQRLDRLKTARERNRLGQFATPPALSLEIARFAWSKLGHHKGGFSFLDPAIGTGSFFGAFLSAFPRDRIEAAMGIELDEPFAEAAREIWQPQGLRVISADFTKLQPETAYNIILTNPPYVRHHHLSANDKQRLGHLAQVATGVRLNGLAGLYCYFLLIAHAWLADNGLAVWLVPSEFMDVNYGDEVKRYLTECVCLLQIHRFCPSDIQFDDALVSSAIVIFEKRLPKAADDVIFSFGGTLMDPAKIDRITRDELRANRKWTSLTRKAGEGDEDGLVTLGDFFAIKRGLATGSNRFFIVPRAKLRELGIPFDCVRPILPSPRYVKQEVIAADADGWPVLDRQLALIDCTMNEEEISSRWPRFYEYLNAGKERGIHEGYLASRRSPWYSQEKREASPFVCTYMGRSAQRPFRFILNRSKATAANVYHMLYPKAHVARTVMERAEEVLDALRAIRREQFFKQGRVYGGGLHKMEPTEMMRLPAGNLAKILGVEPEQQRTLF